MTYKITYCGYELFLEDRFNVDKKKSYFIFNIDDFKKNFSKIINKWSEYKSKTILDNKLLVEKKKIAYDDEDIDEWSYAELSIKEKWDYKEIFYIIYDIETVESENNYFEWYIACALFVDNSGNIGINEVFNNVKEFVDYIFYKIDIIKTTNKRSRLNLMGFNSSRFDDIFLLPEMKKRNIEKIENYVYGEKNGAIIFNNFTICNVELKFIDILRYTGNATNLRNICKQLNVPIQKGYFPLKWLTHNYINYEKEALLDNDGYYYKFLFFKDSEYEEGKKIFKEENRQLLSMKEECIKYCAADVLSSYYVWIKLEQMYFTYIKQGFDYIKLQSLSDYHGAPSLMKYVALMSGKNDCSWLYPIDSKNDIYVPCGKAYNFWKNSIYGGWVGIHYRGCIYDDLYLIDIVSQYPNALTGPMPLGPGRWLEKNDVNDILQKLQTYDLNNLPLFVGKFMCIPKLSTCHVSSLPQRNIKTKTILWSYLKQEGYYNSIDLWIACKFDKWKFIAISGCFIHDIKGTYFEKFVKILAKMKKEGKDEKNDMKYNMAKIGMNSAIGKFSEKNTIIKSIIARNENEYFNILDDINKNKQLTLMNVDYENDVWILRVKSCDIMKNNIPIQIGSCMFSYSRLSRLLLIKNCYNDKKLSVNCQIENNRPIVFYGDTDSVVTTKKGYENLLRRGFIGKEIKGYNIHHKKLYFNAELELISKFSCFLNLKSYLLFGTKNNSKLRLKGHRLFNPNDEACLQHKYYPANECKSCQCKVTRLYKHFCYHCLSLTYIFLNDEEGLFDKEIISPGEFVLPIHFLLALKAYIILINYNRFDRTLSVGRSNQEKYKIKKVIRTIKFKECTLYHKYDCSFLPLLYPMGSKDLWK